MIIKIFTVFDQKAEAYLPPFFMSHEGQAQRTFTDCINSPEHSFGAHPEDYTLFALGDFDDSNASFQPLSTPKSLGKGIEFVNSNSPETVPNGQISDEQPLQPST